MKGLGGRVADLPDNAGLSASEQVGIEDEKFKDKREVVAGHPRIAECDSSGSTAAIG